MTTRFKKIKPEDIINATASYFMLPPSSIKGKCRMWHVAYPRHFAAYLIKKHLPDTPYKEIGKIMSGRDPSTIAQSLRNIERDVNAIFPHIRESAKNIINDIENIMRRKRYA